MAKVPLPIALVGASHFHQAPGRHPHPQIIAEGSARIELVTGGRGAFLHEGIWFDVGPGDLLWQWRGDQTIGRSDFADPYRCLALHYQVPPGSIRPVARHTRWPDAEAVLAYTRHVLAAWVDPRCDRDLLAIASWSALLLRAQRWLHRAADPDLPAPLQMVLTTIEQEFAEDLGIEALAARAGWSGSHLHAAFRRHLATSPHKHLAARRLRAARELLSGSDLPIAEIARRCGYANAAHFSRAFRQDAGVTAAAFRHRQADPGRW